MALILVESTDFVIPTNLSLLGENYELTLEQSIQNLLAEIDKENLDLSHFTRIFYELMQARVDPAMESIWFYAILTFRSRSSTNGDLLDRVTAVKDLFQLVSSCSASCGSSKSIALLAPVVSEVYKVIADMLGNDLASKRKKKAMREVKSLVDGILGYINLCSCKNLETDGELITSFMDLVCIWTYPNKELEQFLPLVSGEICRGLSAGVRDVRYLAGVVIAEAFLLKLCLYFHGESSRQDLEKDLRIWAVSSITAIRNFYFFETLVRIQLEATLPVMSLLSTEFQVLLRRVLYDALILADYSFLNPEKAINLPAENVACLAVKRLILTHEAIKFFREHGDQNRAISYLNAFSSSLVPSQIIKLMGNQILSKENVNRPNGLSLKFLIQCLLKAEDQGLRVFDDSISKFRAELVLDISKSDSEYPMLEGNKVDDNLFFYIDNQGEKANNTEDDKAIDESVNAAFIASSMSMTENGTGKRKRRKKAEGENKIKFVKYDLFPDSDATKLSSAIDNDDSNKDSEVQNPNSDEDTDSGRS